MANPVGYQQILIPKGYSIFTPTFKNVDSTKTMTLGDIIVLNEYGAEFDGQTNTGDNDHHISNGKVKLMKLYTKTDDYNTAGDMMDAMAYTTVKKNDVTKKWDANSDVQLKASEAVVVNNTGNTPVFFKLKKPIEK